MEQFIHDKVFIWNIRAKSLCKVYKNKIFIDFFIKVVHSNAVSNLDHANHSVTTYVVSTLDVTTKHNATRSLNIWHKRVGHVNHAMIKQMEQKNMVNGLYITNEDIPFCTRCIHDKSRRKEFPWMANREHA